MSHGLRLLLSLSSILTVFSSAAEPGPVIRAEEIVAPAAGANASGPSVTVSPEGVVWLSWLERDGAMTTLRFSTLDAAEKRWTAARPIASGREWFVNAADFPALTVGPGGRATAVWFVNNPAPAKPATTAHDHDGPGYRAFTSQTTDAGQSWSPPVALTVESRSVEFVSLATLADGRVLAAWLDGRGKTGGGKKQQLFARVVGTEGPDVLVDPSVCDCCQTALTAFPDGTALLVYRGRSDEEVRDVRVTRFRGREWDEPRTLYSDDWRIAGCPVNGPQLASDGGRVAVAWFTGAENDPRVLASMSTDAGARFLMPLRISGDKTAGRVSTVLLHHGAFLVSHVDLDGGLVLRRVNPDFATSDPVVLATPAAGRIKGFPRLALLRDYAGGKVPALAIAAFLREGAAGLQTLLISVPEGDLLEAEKNCDCSPTTEQLQGFSIRGSVVSTQPGATVMRVRHFEVPGIFVAGEREFRVAPEVTTRAGGPGQQFLGRVEKRDGDWWLFDVRLIALPPAR